MTFWAKADFSVLRLGFSCDHVTASHSAVVGLGLSKPGELVVSELTKKFERNFDSWEKGPLHSVNEKIKYYLHHTMNAHDQSLSIIDRDDVISFADFNRNYEACMPAIKRFLLSFKKFPADMPSQYAKIIVACQNSKSDWAYIVAQTQLSGKAEATSVLRKALSYLLKI